MKNPFKNRIVAVGVGAAVLVLAGGIGGATASGLIDSSQIKDNSVRSVDLMDGSGVRLADLTPGALSTLSQPLAGAVYRTAHYDNGGGGIATVACADDDATSQNYVAISGGAYSIRSTNPVNTATQPITSSFAGRMDWTTNTPKPGRLDGWIVNFGTGDQPDATHGTLEIYALCVPTTVAKQVNHY